LQKTKPFLSFSIQEFSYIYLLPSGFEACVLWHKNCLDHYQMKNKYKRQVAMNRLKKGFTLIELMIVVVIIGILAALAIPRFLSAAKKSKVSEARLVLKQIWQGATNYYHDDGMYPPCDVVTGASTAPWVFNNASTKNTTWDRLVSLEIDAPSGYPRFTYGIDNSGTVFRAYALASGSYDASLHDVSTMYIDEQGNMTGGTW
jgi:prepilin-type N-terminal cleavage/methylation domain-containing protein